MKIISVSNQKGGVGKTTCAVNIGAGLVRLRQSVLLIDLDPQAHLTYSLGIQADNLDRTVYDLLKGQASVEDILIDREQLKIVPASLTLSGASLELSNVAGREVLLREALESLKGFDWVLIDCPPSLGLLTLNAFTSAHEVYIPLQAEFLAMQGMSKLLRAIEIVKKRLNQRLRVTGIIATRFDARRRLNREVLSKIRERFGSTVFDTIIRENIALAEAPSYGKTIYDYSPNSYGAEDFMRLSHEIIQRNNRARIPKRS